MEQIVKSADNTLLLDRTTSIREALKSVVGEFIKIGFWLWEIRENHYYKDMGYSDVVEYAEKELNLKRSSTFNFIKVCETYSEKSKGKPTPRLKKQYLNYSGSQLTEMLSLSPADREEITPDMSVKQIREKKAQLKAVKTEEEPDEKVQTSGQESIEVKAEIVNGDTGSVSLEALQKDFYDFRDALKQMVLNMEADKKITKAMVIEAVKNLLSIYQDDSEIAAQQIKDLKKVQRQKDPHKKLSLMLKTGLIKVPEEPDRQSDSD